MVHCSVMRWCRAHYGVRPLQRTFDTLKAKLTSAPVLKLPDFDKPFKLCCDVSVVGLGAELSQEQFPVAFFSKKLTPTEARYYVTDREFMTIFKAYMK